MVPRDVLMCDPPDRIAVFRALQLGDLLCAVPALRALRAAWPRARITLIGLPWAADLARRLGQVDDFLAFPGFPGMPEGAAKPEGLPRFLDAAQDRRFDLVLQLHGSGVISNVLVAALGARHCAGFRAPEGWCPDPQWFLPWPHDLPEIRRLLALTRFLGAPAADETLELPLLPGEREDFEALRPGLPRGPYACIHPGARLASRRWPEQRFARVADELAEAGFAIVLTGSAGEAELIARVRGLMRAPAVNLAGRTTLGTLAQVVARAALVVCNDTGLSHVAAAMQTPSVVVSCGGDAERWRPLDRARHRVLWRAAPCRPCAFDHCPTGHECALGVEAGEVAAQALRLARPEQESHHA